MARYVKVLRAGERFWAEDLGAGPSGGRRLRCDNHTTSVGAPRYGEEFIMADDEIILDEVSEDAPR